MRFFIGAGEIIGPSIGLVTTIAERGGFGRRFRDG